MKTKLDKEELWRISNCLKNRIKETLGFIEPKGLVADFGENNPLKESVEKHFKIKIDSIDHDFNWLFPYIRKYDTILCFEVLEHLFNPLTFLTQLKKMLKNGGSIYLSTPYQFPIFLKAKHHYHEIPTDRLMWLFEEAGLKIVRSKKITIAGNWYNHIGIRPFLRYLQKTRIYELKII